MDDTIGNSTTTPNTDSGWFGNILSNVKDIGTVATGVIGAVKGGTKPVPQKPIAGASGFSTQTILLIAAGGLTVLLVVMMFLRKK